MAKSARASRIKKNNQALKKRVFGPVEAARNERLNAKLLDIASQPKPLRAEMDVETEGAITNDAEKADESKAAETTMDVDETASTKPRFRSERNAKQKKQKANRIAKAHRRPRNSIVFEKTGRAKSKKGSKR